MSARILPALADLSPSCDVLLCDVWGVIHNGRHAFRPAAAALSGFRAAGGKVVLVSNAPRPSALIPAQLERLGVPADAWDRIVTSGDATRAEIVARGPLAYRIGPSKDEALYEGLDVRFVDAAAADYVICTGPRDDLSEAPETYRAELAVLAARGLPFVCANPDRVVQFGGRLIPCAGALADIYADLGGEVVMAGKPYPPIYALALAAAGEILGRPVDPARVLCVGDGAQTDVAGAAAMKLDCLFIADGIHAAELSGPDGLDTARVDAFLAAHGGKAKWVQTGLA